jgi:hypothetical protein
MTTPTPILQLRSQKVPVPQFVFVEEPTEPAAVVKVPSRRAPRTSFRQAAPDHPMTTTDPRAVYVALLAAFRKLDSVSRANLLRALLVDLRADLAGLPRGVGPSLSTLLALQRAAQDLTVPLPPPEPVVVDDETANPEQPS